MNLNIKDYGDYWENVLNTEHLAVFSPMAEALVHGSDEELRRFYNFDYKFLGGEGQRPHS